MVSKKYLHIITFLLFFNLLNVKNLHSQSFMGIAINGSQQSIKSKLLDKGFKFIMVNQNREYLYKGKFINGEDINLLVTSTATSKKVHTFTITFNEIIDSWSSLKSEFEKHNEILIKKYGKPLMTSRAYNSKQFIEGEGDELIKLESGKLNYVNFWIRTGQSQNLSVYLAISSSKQIVLSYSNVSNLNLDLSEKESLIDITY